MGGLGVVNPANSSFQFSASVEAVHCSSTSPYLQQSRTYPTEVLSSQVEAKHAIPSVHYQSVTDSHDALIPMLSPSLC